MAKIKKTYKVSTKEMINEHKRLIPELKKAGLTKEVRVQSKELQAIEKKTGSLKRKFKMGKDDKVEPGTFINKAKELAIKGLI